MQLGIRFSMLALLFGTFAFMSASCGGSEFGGPGGGPPGSPPGSNDNPCSYTVKGDIDDRIEMNAHFGLRRRGGLQSDRFELVVVCLHDPPGSSQQGISPAIEIPFEGPRDYAVDDVTHGSGRIVLGNRAGSVVFVLDGSGGERGACTVSMTQAPAAAAGAAKVGDRIEASFHCEGLTTESLGKEYSVSITDGTFGGTIESIEP